MAAVPSDEPVVPHGRRELIGAATLLGLSNKHRLSLPPLCTIHLHRYADVAALISVKPNLCSEQLRFCCVGNGRVGDPESVEPAEPDEEARRWAPTRLRLRLFTCSADMARTGPHRAPPGPAGPTGPTGLRPVRAGAACASDRSNDHSIARARRTRLSIRPSRSQRSPRHSRPCIRRPPMTWVALLNILAESRHTGIPDAQMSHFIRPVKGRGKC